jgi:hypothetical protein
LHFDFSLFLLAKAIRREMKWGGAKKIKKRILSPYRIFSKVHRS